MSALYLLQFPDVHTREQERRAAVQVFIDLGFSRRRLARDLGMWPAHFKRWIDGERVPAPRRVQWASFERYRAMVRRGIEEAWGR